MCGPPREALLCVCVCKGAGGGRVDAQPCTPTHPPRSPPPPPKNKILQERKHFKDYDPRWTAALKMVTDGVFGTPEYFQDLVDSVNDMTKGVSHAGRAHWVWARVVS